MRSLTLVTAALLLAGLLVAGRGALAGSNATPFGHATDVAGALGPTPTYVSEIGTAITIPPRQQPAQLPASGSGGRSHGVLPLIAGFVLAGSGVVLIQAARAIGRQRPRPAL